MIHRVHLIALAILLSAASHAATIEDDLFRVHFSEGGEALGEQTMAILREAYVRYRERLPAGDEPINVYIAQTPSEFTALGAPAGRRRIEGFARSREGVMVMKAPNLLRPDASYASVARHELLHVLLARNTGEGNLPRWLNEGIAMRISGEYRWSSMYRIATMYGRGNVIDYDSLDYAFAAPGSEEVFGNAYAQSLSMTKYLERRLGEAEFWALVRDLRDTRFEEALHRRLGIGPQQLFEAWKGSLWSVAVVSSLVSGFGVFQAAAVIAVLAYLRKRRRGRRVMRKWAAEEAEEDDIVFPWQLEDQEGPYPWEEDSED